MLKVGKGKSEVTLTGPLADGLERELREALGPVGEEMQREADRILQEEILPTWPVKSGRSRDAWKTALRVHPGSFEVEVTIFNDFDYSRYIKSTRVGEQQDATRIRSPFAVARKAVRAAEKQLAERLAEVLAGHIQGALNGR